MSKKYFALLYLTLVIVFCALLGFSSHFESMEGLLVGLKMTVLAALFWMTIKTKKMPVWILLALLFGVELGIDFPSIAIETDRFSKIFLNLIKTIIAPLIFSTLVIGIASHSNLKQLGRIGLKSFIYFEVVTTIALIVGLFAINLSQAGVGVDLPEANSVIVSKANSLLEHQTDHDVIVDIFPQNIAKSIAENQVLQIVVFSILFAVALSMVREDKKRPMLEFCESLSEVMFKFTHIVMYMAPLAVFGALAFTVAVSGVEILLSLAKLVATLYAAFIAFIVLVFLPIIYIFKIPLKPFIQAISEPVSIAFATATSEAALPKAMENLEKMGASRKIVSFVLPTGYSFNLDGSTLYLSLAAVFVAQLSGVELSIGQQITMCLILILTSKGVAGVRGASFVILVSTVQSLGLDPVMAFPILAVDAIMDMGRTSINVIGNCLATVVIAKSENELHLPKTTE